MRSLVTLYIALIALPVLAQATGDVPLPIPRPDPEDVSARATASTETVSGDTSQDATGIAITPAPPPDREGSPAGPAPARLYQAACPAVLSGAVTAVRLDPLADGLCRARSPLEVRALTVGGKTVALSQPVTVNCGMATVLAEWAGRVDAYTQSVFNSGLAEIRTGTSYFCRSRNNLSGGLISEHGFANALDVVGFLLENGTGIGLPANWADDDHSARTMRFAHDAACGHFTTVLGPEANALHADHLHLDLGCHGKTCTARICE